MFRDVNRMSGEGVVRLLPQESRWYVEVLLSFDCAKHPSSIIIP